MLGFYLSGNPLDDYTNDINELNNINLLNLPNKLPNRIKVGGIITSINKRFDKKNRQWAIIELDGIIGNAEIFIFSDTFQKYENLLFEDNPIFIIGNPSKREEEISYPLKFIANQIVSLDQAKDVLIQNLNILLKFIDNNENSLLEIQKIISENPGKANLILHLESNIGTIKKIKINSKTIAYSDEFLSLLRNKFGHSNVWID